MLFDLPEEKADMPGKAIKAKKSKSASENCQNQKYSKEQKNKQKGGEPVTYDELREKLNEIEGREITALSVKSDVPIATIYAIRSGRHKDAVSSTVEALAKALQG